jgi:preprotein translocase subunit YajC
MNFSAIHLIIILVALLVLLYFLNSRMQSNDSALPAPVVSEHQKEMDKKLGVKY